MTEITTDDARQIQILASEGKQISKIMYQDFPKYGYWDIYWAIHMGGGYSAMGVKRTITNRLKKLKSEKKKDNRLELIEETHELVNQLYEALKFSQKKLDNIRKTLDKE